MDRPFFSIITATYNSEKTLVNTLNSILGQTFSNFEYIIIDGASSDNTIAIIKRYQTKFIEKNINFIYQSEKDTGIYNAWNKGLRIAQGKYISFLGADDTYRTDALQRYYNEIQKNISVDYICSTIEVVSNGIKISEYYPIIRDRKFIKITHVGSFHHRKIFEEYGQYNEDLKVASDYELLLRIDNPKVICINDFLVKMESAGISNASNLGNYEVYKARVTSGKFTNFEAFKYYIKASLEFYVSTYLLKILGFEGKRKLYKIFNKI